MSEQHLGVVNRDAGGIEIEPGAIGQAEAIHPWGAAEQFMTVEPSRGQGGTDSAGERLKGGRPCPRWRAVPQLIDDLIVTDRASVLGGQEREQVPALRPRQLPFV